MLNIVLLTHPSFTGSQSMPRFASMLKIGMEQRGHKVQIWSPEARAFNIPSPESLKKWLGYVDQFFFFPWEIKKRINRCEEDTLFVFTDQALGPWIPLVRNYPHVIHCHDFLAQISALGKVPENPTGWTGRKYQSFIRWGYRYGRNFIAISKKTQRDLGEFLLTAPSLSEVVYNGLNQSFAPQDKNESRIVLSKKFRINLSKGFILHVGGNQWYKNRKGVIEIYNSWRKKSALELPLILIGVKPNKGLAEVYNSSNFKEDIYFMTGVEDQDLRMAYSAATVLLYPSLAEGFGWPIAEAMASGCPVITTGEAPMTEVGGDAAFYIERKKDHDDGSCYEQAAGVLNKVLTLSPEAYQEIIGAGLRNAERFRSKIALDEIEQIYTRVRQTETAEL
ncbi:glycosyltransferase [Zunongwangia sp. F260]|uniref:Glycosyltransferase n=1 Tax=Autumnicola lenta TaxID=3075593 RepID=A0ABU3CIV0_9FLAO|nr:glycosyltransferase [Zunongwangia sp. F260]MDT0646269.1 glycosyltransferase [Zunongwangia sp. F260]